ncbi:MAG: ABC transporter permease, partial [Alistipes sp.]|nr:ABC transporter permease [Candidatus Minthomonas equi]
MKVFTKLVLPTLPRAKLFLLLLFGEKSSIKDSAVMKSPFHSSSFTLFKENFKVSLNAVKANRLRSVLTIAIIATGITSLVGIMSAMQAVKDSVNSNFGKLGAGSFTISASYSATTSEQHKRIKNKRELSYAQIRRFMESYDIPCNKSAYVRIASTDVFKTGDSKSDPRMTLIASDENYLDNIGLDIDKGQMFSKSDVENSAYKCVIGWKTARLLFNEKNPVGRSITIRGTHYLVVGVADRHGDSMESFDIAALIPLSTARASILNEEAAYRIRVNPDETVSREEAWNKAEILFRSIRRLEPSDETDFSIEGNDSALEKTDEILGNISLIALIIGLITLLGAAVGLMNIMLVSVKER